MKYHIRRTFAFKRSCVKVTRSACIPGSCTGVANRKFRLGESCYLHPTVKSKLSNVKVNRSYRMNAVLKLHGQSYMVSVIRAAHFVVYINIFCTKIIVIEKVLYVNNTSNHLLLLQKLCDFHHCITSI